MLFLNDWLPMAKNPQHSTEIIDEEKNRSGYFDEYHDLFTFRKKPVTIEWIVELAHKVRKFADKNTTLRVNDFYDGEGISPDDYYRFKAKCPELQSAHAYLKRRIASRRDKGALGAGKKKFDAMWASKNQWRYDPLYLEGVRREAVIKAQATAEIIKGELRKIIVEVEETRSTGLVPKKKKKKDDGISDE